MNISMLGRYALSISATIALLTACGGSQSAMNGAVPAARGVPNTASGSKTFQYTGAEQSFKVPAGVKSITVVARGAAGAPWSAKAHNHKHHGRGGRVYAVIPVHPGETLYVFAGGGGSKNTDVGSFNGGAPAGAYPTCLRRSGAYCYGWGGGGASDVREGGDSLADRILVSGGGGGASGQDAFGGGGGGTTGGAGLIGNHYYHCGGSKSPCGGGGGGGTQSQGGAGGAGGVASPSESGPGDPGNTGTLASGGSGGAAGTNPSNPGSGFDGGPGGGGGGGYYGGGGGGGGIAPNGGSAYGNPGGGGGGGSSYVEPRATNVRFWQNWKNATDNGLVVFSW